MIVKRLDNINISILLSPLHIVIMTSEYTVHICTYIVYIYTVHILYIYYMLNF